MPKRSSKGKYGGAVDRVLEDCEALSRLMREMGRRGGLKGGKARAETLTAEERKEIAVKGAKARWKNKRPKRS